VEDLTRAIDSSQDAIDDLKRQDSVLLGYRLLARAAQP
jgi:hypothetical protein